MGIIEDKKKFKISKKQSNPTNFKNDSAEHMNTFDIDEKTIKKQQNKK